MDNVDLNVGDVLHHKWFYTEPDFTWSAEVDEIIESSNELKVFIEHGNGYSQHQTWDLADVVNGLKSGEYIKGEPIKPLKV